jgi:hypothetical protein
MMLNFLDVKLWRLTAGAGILMAVGCSRADRWDMSGNVTYGGQPVNEGHITFDPVTPGKGGGFARINDGKFDTRVEGRNHPGGPHKVTIAAYKGLKNPKNPDSDVLLLFPAYIFEVELPTHVTTMDFDVPADWKGDESQ